MTRSCADQFTWDDLPVDVWVRILQVAVPHSRSAFHRLSYEDFARLIQLSTVSSKFAEAALLMPALRYGLPAYPGPPQGVQLGSAFALQCAGQMKALWIGPKVFRLPGLAAFVAAAQQVTSVSITCTSIMEAAQADYLLGQCSTVTLLALSGTYMPAVLPASVTEVNACFDAPAECECSTSQLSALIHHAALLPQLRILGLRFHSTNQPAVVPLQPLVQLPFLQSLHISTIQVSAPYIDLKWVQQQACSRLAVFMEADTHDIAKHAVVVEQLSHMPPGTLDLFSLDMEVPFTSELQALWSRPEVPHRFLDNYAATVTPLHMLPRCSELRWEYSPLEPGPACISWQALMASGAAKISLDVNGELHVKGAGSCDFQHLTQPWQLEVISAVAVHGLPASQPTAGCKYFLQNDAALAAGWTSSRG